jgi:hypothetical protein
MRTVFACVALVLGGAVATTGAAKAALIFDNFDAGGFTTVRGAGDSPGTLITVGASNVTIGQIGVRNDLNANGNLEFLIFDHPSHTLLFASAAKAFVDDGMSWKLSDALSFTLLAGQSYDIGAIADIGGLWSFDITPESMGGITSLSQNSNFANFAAPFVTGHAGADVHLQLFAADAAVPEPGALPLLGLGVLGLALARRRRAR